MTIQFFCQTTSFNIFFLLSYIIDDTFVVNLIKSFLTFFDDCKNDDDDDDDDDDDFIAFEFDFFVKYHCEKVKISRISINEIYKILSNAKKTKIKKKL